MRCPYCGIDNDKVVDSRATDAGKAIRRRRQCLGCKKRFTTYEHIEENARLMVIKKDATRVPFDRAKVLAGVEKACYKRPVSVEQMGKLVDEVEEEIFRTHDRDVEAVEIGRAVAEKLKGVDQVAYVRFASVYKQFRDADDLMRDLRETLELGKPDIPGQGKLFS